MVAARGMKKPAEKLTREQLRELAAQKKTDAKALGDRTRTIIKERREQLKNPPKAYVEMPAPTGDAEVDAAADLEAVESGFNKRRADEEARFNKAVDSGFWLAVCFRTREQRDAFIDQTGIKPDWITSCYFDGDGVAKKLGVTLPDPGERVGNKPLDPVFAKFVDPKRVAKYEKAVAEEAPAPRKRVRK